MIQKLEKKLTALYTLTTAIILLAVVAAIAFISQLDLMNKTEEEFQRLIMNIGTKLQTDSFFNVSWIASMEAENRLIIHIEENGKPLLYQSSWKSKSDRDYLINAVKEQAKLLRTDVSAPPVSATSISPVFTLKGREQDQYKCIAVSYPSQVGYKSMILLYDISPVLNNLKKQSFLFAAAAILGIAALYLAARKFVKNAVSPVEINNQKQREFVASASHELRSPLMVIQSSIQAMEVAPEKSQQFTQNIMRECKRMGCLVNDMLTLASLDANNWAVSLEEVDPNTLLIEFYELYEPICIRQKVPFALDLPEELLPRIKGDKERLLQIISILMDNALAYNKDMKPTNIEAHLEKSSVCIKVIDHGIGISDEDKKVIFDRFYRTDTSRKDKQHFGLGLSIAKELITLHGGSIHVSDTLGGGTTFSVKIPLL